MITSIPCEQNILSVMPSLIADKNLYGWIVWGGISTSSKPWNPPCISYFFPGSLEASGPFNNNSDVLQFINERENLYPMIRLTSHRISLENEYIESIELFLTILAYENIRVRADMDPFDRHVCIDLISGPYWLLPDKLTWAGIKIDLNFPDSI